jgi:predicted nuclease of restriction endonuclease-like (RecB) superfamily
MSKSIPASSYTALFHDIKNRIRSAQYEALKAVNKELIGLYWDIGRMIVSRQVTSRHGKSVVEKLSVDLISEFPGIQGFSASNLWRMRTFYFTYSQQPKLAPLVREISWSHNIAVLEKCADAIEREFYIRMTRRMGWSKNVLIHQIEANAFRSAALNQTNFKKVLAEPVRDQAKISVKDEYLFDFLEIAEDHSEAELEKGLMDQMTRFLDAMGGLFAFVGRQHRLEIDGREFFIDILLYHRRLKCLVAVELKVGEFKPEYAGKMQFYLAALDDLARMPEENPSIGIILCKTKSRTIVEYSLRESRKPMGVASYKVVRDLPADLRGELPTTDQISELMGSIQLKTGDK